jgi:hypothetical protein
LITGSNSAAWRPISRKCFWESRRPPKAEPRKKDAELWSRLEARGDKDPAKFLSGLVANEADPQSPEPRFVNVEVRITKATTVSQGRENLQFISELKADGRIDVEYADALLLSILKLLMR